MKPQNKDNLIQGICMFWAKVTPEKCCRYIDHLKRVIPNVLEVNGEAPGYRTMQVIYSPLRFVVQYIIYYRYDIICML